MKITATKRKKPCISTIYEVFSFYRTPPTLLTFLPSHRNPAANDCRCLFPPPRHPLSAPPAAAAAAPDGRQKNGEGPLSGPSLRSKLRHCSRISEDSFHCMQVDTGSRSGETAGWFHPGYSDCFMTARLLKSLLKKRCAEPDSGNSRITPLFKYELVRNRAYHVLTVHQSHSIGDYCARINSRAVFPIPNIEKLIVFIKKFIQYLVFFILIGLCAH